MNWYKGDIAQAVAESRKKNAIFLVFISGNDAASEKLLNMIETDKIRSQLESEHFVAIRIQSDSQTYMQFASIYQMAPVPSIFFIGSTGTPIEIGTAIMNTADELDEKIKRALQEHLPKTTNDTASSSLASTNSIAAEQKNTGDDLEVKATTSKTEEKTETTAKENSKSDDTEIVCEGDVCFKRSKETLINKEPVNVGDREDAGADAASAQTAAATNVTDVDAAANQTAQAQATDFDARLAATRELLAQKRRAEIEESKKLEKERELQRRREGKEIQHMQEWQREKEHKDLKATLRREREEEQQARERILAQIAADRAERAQRAAEPTAAAAAKDAKPTVTAASTAATAAANNNNNTSVRLQFRFVNGETKTHTFATLDTISNVREFVSAELLQTTGHKEFTLATVYPRHEFTVEDEEKTLVDLGLFPSAVILVITKESSTPAAIIKSHGGIVNIFSTLIWSVLSPIFSVFNYLRGTLFGRNNNGNNAAAGAEATSGAQKRANEDSPLQADAAKRRNLERFMTGPSTSRDARLNTQSADLADQSNEQKPYRRYGTSNVHRLSDKRKDSDDENATWNGNSTQQQ